MRTEIIPEREAGGGLQGAGQAFLHAGAEKRAPQAAEDELALAPEGVAPGHRHLRSRSCRIEFASPGCFLAAG